MASDDEPANGADEGDKIPNITLQDFGIEEDTPIAFVRRAGWNKGFRHRRDYGPMKIPIAFVKGKVAVFVDTSQPDNSKDANLKEEG